MPTSDDRSWLLNNSTDPESVTSYYDGWAQRYDAELSEWDYQSPAQAARLLARYAPLGSAVLDAGCGTGLSGEALAAADFQDIVGIDISPASLKLSAARGVYSKLQQVDLHSLPLPFEANAFDALVCVGVLTYVQEVSATLKDFCRLVRPSGYIVFTCRDDLYQEQRYPQLLTELVDEHCWQSVYQSPPSPYLPKNADFGEKIKVIYCVYQTS
jgi:predicted TPR repeat methyltransferase